METLEIPPIRIENLSKVYRGKRGRRVQALQGISLDVKRGEIFGFLGPNGAGKSTTIKTLLGLVRPTSGQALLCGKPAAAVASRRHVGYLPENPAFYEFLTGREYLQFVADTFELPSGQAASSIDRALNQMSLLDAANRPIRGYSKGMVQRLGLAQALIHDPDVYVLDEPMSGLDPQGRALVKDVIRDLGQQGKTVFFSTHITADVERVCDRLAIICQGKIETTASVAEILRQGIEGYRLTARGVVSSCYPGATQVCNRGEEVDFQVSQDKLSALIDAVKAHGGTVELVEPLRRDLEQYFLEIVEQSSS